MRNAKTQTISPRWDSNLQPLYAKLSFADNLIVQTDLQRYLYFHLKARLAPNVFRIYEYYLGAMPEATLEAWDLHFCARLAKGASGKTLNNELGVYKGYFRWLGGRGVNSFDSRLLAYPHFRHVPKKYRRALTAEEISRLRTVSGPRWAWWAFLLYTGLRKSEFEALKWSDVLDGSIRVTDAKNPMKQRVVPLRPELVEVLSRLPQGLFQEKLFKLPRRQCSLLRIFRRDLVRAGISQEIDLHCLRVTFVSALARAGVSPRTAQELAGHSDIRTTLKIYTKVTDRDKVDAVNRLVF